MLRLLSGVWHGWLLQLFYHTLLQLKDFAFYTAFSDSLQSSDFPLQGKRSSALL